MSRQFQFAQWLSNVIDNFAGHDIAARQKRMQALADFKKQKQMSNLQVQHELNMLEIKFAEQLQRVQERESRITQDYREFLDQIDEMKIQIVEAFPDMPKVMALVIHQHAKHLVDKMWNDSSDKDHSLFQAELTAFLGMVLDDTTRVLIDNDRAKIPSKTLQHIQNHAQIDSNEV